MSSSCFCISSGTSGFSKSDIGIRRTTIKESDMIRKSVMSIAAMRDIMYLNIGFS